MPWRLARATPATPTERASASMTAETVAETRRDWRRRLSAARAPSTGWRALRDRGGGEEQQASGGGRKEHGGRDGRGIGGVGSSGDDRGSEDRAEDAAGVSGTGAVRRRAGARPGERGRRGRWPRARQGGGAGDGRGDARADPDEGPFDRGRRRLARGAEAVDGARQEVEEARDGAGHRRSERDAGDPADGSGERAFEQEEADDGSAGGPESAQDPDLAAALGGGDGERVVDDEYRDEQGEQLGDLEGDGERAGQRFHAAAEAGGGVDLIARAERVEDAAAAVLDLDAVGDADVDAVEHPTRPKTFWAA